MNTRKLGGKTYKSNHPLSVFLVDLLETQARLFCIPKDWGDFTPYQYAVQLLYYIEAAINDQNPRDKEIYIQEIVETIEKQSKFINDGASVKSMISSVDQNKDFMLLLASVRRAHASCTNAYSYIELESKELSPNLLYILEKTMEALDVFEAWVEAFFKVFSFNEEGKMIKDARVSLWDIETVKGLNV